MECQEKRNMLKGGSSLFIKMFQDKRSILYKRDESLGKSLVAAITLAAEGLLEQDEHCKSFIERVINPSNGRQFIDVVGPKEFCFYTRSLFIEQRATDNVILDESSI